MNNLPGLQALSDGKTHRVVYYATNWKPTWDYYHGRPGAFVSTTFIKQEEFKHGSSTLHG